MARSRMSLGASTRRAVTRILGSANGFPERSRASRAITAIACRLQLFVFELERARQEDLGLAVEGLLWKLQKHCQLLMIASRSGGGIQSGYALLSELSVLLEDLEVQVLSLPNKLGKDDHYKPALDELQALLANVARYRSDCDETRDQLEAALSDLLQDCHQLPAALPTADLHPAAAPQCRGIAKEANQVNPNRLAAPASPSSSSAVASTVDGASCPTDAVLLRVKHVVRSLELDVPIGDLDQDLDSELLQLRGRLQKAITRQQAASSRPVADWEPESGVLTSPSWVSLGKRGGSTRPGCGEDGSVSEWENAGEVAAVVNNGIGWNASGGRKVSGSGGGGGGRAEVTPERLSRLHDAARHVSRSLAAEHLAGLKEQQRRLLHKGQGAEERSESAGYGGGGGNRGGSDGGQEVDTFLAVGSESSGDISDVDVSVRQHLPSNQRRRLLLSSPPSEATAATVGERAAGIEPVSPPLSSPAGGSHAVRPPTSSAQAAVRPPTRVAALAGGWEAGGPSAVVTDALQEPCQTVPEQLAVQPPPAAPAAVTAAGTAASAFITPPLVSTAALATQAPCCPGPQPQASHPSPHNLPHSPRPSPPHVKQHAYSPSQPLPPLPELPNPARVAPLEAGTTANGGGGGGGALFGVSPFVLMALRGTQGVQASPLLPPGVGAAQGHGPGPPGGCDDDDVQEGDKLPEGAAAGAREAGPAAAGMAGTGEAGPGAGGVVTAGAPGIVARPETSEGSGGEVAAPKAAEMRVVLEDGGEARRSSGGGAGRGPGSPTAAAVMGVAVGWRQRGVPGPAPLPLPEASVHLRAVGFSTGSKYADLTPINPAAADGTAPIWPCWPPGVPYGPPGYRFGGGIELAGTGGGGNGAAGGIAVLTVDRDAVQLPYLGPDVPTLDLRKDITGWGACLGRGAFGTVYKALFRNKPVAVKLLHASTLDSRDLRSLISEIHTATRLTRHPNIISVYGAAVAPPDEVALVTELMDCDLYDYIHRRRQNCVPLDEVLFIAHSIAAGLAALHPAVVHRDLKPANILLRHHHTAAPSPTHNELDGEPHHPFRSLERRLTVKIADFGLARHKRTQYLSTRERHVGTLKYMAPECFGGSRSDGDGGGASCGCEGGGRITEKCDVYSFGVLLYELITGREPWEGYHALYAFSQVQSGATLPLPDDPARCPPALAALVRSCWSPAHHLRPSSGQLVGALEEIARGGAGGAGGAA